MVIKYLNSKRHFFSVFFFSISVPMSGIKTTDSEIRKIISMVKMIDRDISIEVDELNEQVDDLKGVILGISNRQHEHVIKLKREAISELSDNQNEVVTLRTDLRQLDPLHETVRVEHESLMSSFDENLKPFANNELLKRITRLVHMIKNRKSPDEMFAKFGNHVDLSELTSYGFVDYFDPKEIRDNFRKQALIMLESLLRDLQSTSGASVEMETVEDSEDDPMDEI